MRDLAAGSAAASGADLYALVRELFPLPRSLTGDGVRRTLERLARVAPMQIHEVPSGERVLDWTVPDEWNVREAWIESEAGQRIVDHAAHTLHLVGYSTPVQATLSLEELQPHLHSDPRRPDVIPYRTSYYTRDWGFCLTQRQREALQPGAYRVHIDASLGPGSLSYGEVLVPGDSPDEVLFYTHTCHPSLANDNLSGMAVCAFLASWLGEARRRLTYRLVFAPGTIGSITWLARNPEAVSRLKAGLVVALVGDPGPLRYKRSWSGVGLMDRVAGAWLARESPGATCSDFSPWGYDERQFASPGFRLPVGRLTRSAEEGYPEYHSSADDLSLVRPDALAGALAACQAMVGILESNRPLRSRAPLGEPQLGRRGLYRSLGGPPSAELQRALLWVLAFGDGEHELLDVYVRSQLPWNCLVEAADRLAAADLLG